MNTSRQSETEQCTVNHWVDTHRIHGSQRHLNKVNVTKEQPMLEHPYNKQRDQSNEQRTDCHCHRFAKRGYGVCLTGTFLCGTLTFESLLLELSLTGLYVAHGEARLGKGCIPGRGGGGSWGRQDEPRNGFRMEGGGVLVWRGWNGGSSGG